MTRPGSAWVPLSMGEKVGLPSSSHRHQPVVWVVAVPDVDDDRQDDGEDDPLLDADDHHDRGCQGRDHELVWSDTQDVVHPDVVDQPDADQEDDCGEDGVRHVGERPRQEQEDDDDDRARGQLGYLTAPASAVDHLGLGRAAVDRERPGHPRTETGRPEPDQVDVLLEAVAVLHGVGT